MTYDLNHYRFAIVPQIKLWMQSRPNVTPISQLSELALVTNCPLVVVAYLLMELYGVNTELQEKIRTLSKFYSVTNIKNYGETS